MSTTATRNAVLRVRLGTNPIGEWANDPQRACAGTDPEFWFPATQSPFSVHVQQVKALCARCPVLEPCRDYGLATPGLYGVWGGLTEYDRGRILLGGEVAA